MASGFPWRVIHDWTLRAIMNAVVIYDMPERDWKSELESVINIS